MQSEPQLADALNWVPTILDLPTYTGIEPVPSNLPSSYLEFLDLVHPGEGFVGYEYLRLFALEQLPWVNCAYQVATYLPGYYLFGSNGCGEAYMFGPPDGERPVIRTAFVPLDLEYVSESWPDFPHFLLGLVSAPRQYDDSSYPDTPNPEAFGLEIHEVHPIALGGSPTDPANRLFVPVAKHAELVSFWNKTFPIVKRQRTRA
jgi:hypothetical protein